MLWFYKKATQLAKPLLKRIIYARLRRGKEDHERLQERFGEASLPRPEGIIIWIHVASVGEAQSMLALINTILQSQKNLHILVTSGTVTSAHILQSRLPERTCHQYIPVDHPEWVRRFLDHWKPNCILWAESELWPNMMMQIKKRNIPTALINGRLSPKSFSHWKKIRTQAERLLETFDVILTQTETDTSYFKTLGARSVITTGNIKYSAQPLPFSPHDLTALQEKTANRPCWIYASTHDGEEDIACTIHKNLKKQQPGLLTIIAPRHPARQHEIEQTCQRHAVSYSIRNTEKNLPQEQDDIYIVNTIGELGLFYRLAPIACIGRSFSNDGGGGHNPLEAALLGCVVCSGPHTQNLSEIYNDMEKENAIIRHQTPDSMESWLHTLLKNPQDIHQQSQHNLLYAQKKASILNIIMHELEPVFLRSGLHIAHTKKDHNT